MKMEKFDVRTCTKRMRDLREDHDLKQKHVAQMPGITQQQYSRYETGKARPPIDVLLTLAEYYHIPLDDLVGRSPVKNHAMELKLLVHFRKLDQNRRHAVMHFIAFQQSQQT